MRKHNLFIPQGSSTSSEVRFAQIKTLQTAHQTRTNFGGILHNITAQRFHLVSMSNTDDSINQIYITFYILNFLQHFEQYHTKASRQQPPRYTSRFFDFSRSSSLGFPYTILTTLVDSPQEGHRCRGFKFTGISFILRENTLTMFY